MAFYDVYSIKPGDNLTVIGRKWGFQNPGPIYNYPRNRFLLRNRSPDLIYPGETVFIPWHPDLLQKVIATSNHLITTIKADAAKLISEQYSNKKKLEQFLFKIDAVNFLASIGSSIGSLVVKGARGVEMTSKEVLLWLIDSRVSMGSSMATMVIPSPQAPKRDFKYYVRHALGPWNPSYWASFWTAIVEKDVDIFLYGADATAYKASGMIKKQAERDIGKLKRKVMEARQQFDMSFYKHRV